MSIDALDLVPQHLRALVLERATEVYYDALKTGFASAYLNQGVPADQAQAYASLALQHIVPDPAHRFEITAAVERRLRGGPLPAPYVVPGTPEVPC